MELENTSPNRIYNKENVTILSIDLNSDEFTKYKCLSLLKESYIYNKNYKKNNDTKVIYENYMLLKNTICNTFKLKNSHAINNCIIIMSSLRLWSRKNLPHSFTSQSDDVATYYTDSKKSMIGFLRYNRILFETNTLKHIRKFCCDYYYNVANYDEYEQKKLFTTYGNSIPFRFIDEMRRSNRKVLISRSLLFNSNKR